MSDSDSDDYGELDFVSAASTNLKSVLRKPISTASISPSLGRDHFRFHSDLIESFFFLILKIQILLNKYLINEIVNSIDL